MLPLYPFPRTFENVENLALKNMSGEGYADTIIPLKDTNMGPEFTFNWQQH
jgi:hypothetical protein